MSPPNNPVFGIIYQNVFRVSDMRALWNASDFSNQDFGTDGFGLHMGMKPFDPD